MLQGDEDYSVTAFNYIHQNPFNANLVKQMEDWNYSSFRDYAGLQSNSLCNKQLAIEKLGLQMDNFVSNSYEVLNDSLVAKIF